MFARTAARRSRRVVFAAAAAARGVMRFNDVVDVGAISGRIGEQFWWCLCRMIYLSGGRRFVKLMGEFVARIDQVLGRDKRC